MTRVRVAVVLALAVFVAACSGSGGDNAAPGIPTSTTEQTSAMTVDHRYGTTTIPKRPERIVALDNQWLDILVALDAPVVAAALDPVIEGGRYPWQQLPDTVQDIRVGDSIPYEAIAAQRPDLIVITWAAPAKADYDRLSKIAPTVPPLDDREIVAWQDLAALAGRILGVPDRATALIDEAAARNEKLAADLPGLQGKTYALANYVPGDAIYVVADETDGSAAFFSDLGLKIDPDLVAVAAGASGRAKLSLERVDMLDADLLVILTNGADPAEIPGYAALPAVQRNAVATLDVAPITGLNTPTPLSLPYAIEQLRPALEAAAG